MRLVLWFAVFLSVCLAGCTPKWDIDSEDVSFQVVVEGWIDSGDFANVCLSRSISLSALNDTISMAGFSLHLAKVTVSDGENSEILTERYNANYFPTFIYTGNVLRGIPGKTYTLTVEYRGRTLTAETTIPEPTVIEDTEVSLCDNSDTLYQVKVKIQDDKSKKEYFKFFTQTLPYDTRYYSPYIGTFNDNLFSASEDAVQLAVYRGIRDITIPSTMDYVPYFTIDDTVRIKLCTIDEAGFDFWSDYENEVSNRRNPIFPSTTNLRSNIQGGLGIWCGYGVAKKTVCIRQ